ncbi:MAG: hypothetical protein JRE57_03840 [Deltaproteobacteria bacterium]|nr:hypothetical protein [Deltaproteobacteria bacterium]
MKHPLLKLEPLIWLLFGQGILLGTVLLTPWVLVVGLAIPLGIVPEDALSYERATMLASHIFGRLILFGLIVRTPHAPHLHRLRRRRARCVGGAAALSARNDRQCARRGGGRSNLITPIRRGSDIGAPTRRSRVRPGWPRR